MVEMEGGGVVGWEEGDGEGEEVGGEVGGSGLDRVSCGRERV